MPDPHLTPEQAKALLIRWQQLADEHAIEVSPSYGTGHDGSLHDEFFCDARISHSFERRSILVARTRSVVTALSQAIGRIEALGDGDSDDLEIPHTYYPPRSD